LDGEGGFRKCFAFTPRFWSRALYGHGRDHNRAKLPEGK
jgi:hypothetical protein